MESSPLLDNEISNVDADIDMESFTASMGTDWADTVDDSADKTSDLVSDSESSLTDALWTTIMSRQSNNLAAANARGSSGAADFVILYSRSQIQKLQSKTNAPIHGGRSFHGGLLSSFSGPELQHKSVVEPIFLAYNHVSTETRHMLMQVATAIAQSLGDDTAVDVVQPMRTGWWLYLCTHADRARLVAQGINLVGKHIPLHSEFRLAQRRSVKVTIWDLLLHEVDNEQVLEHMNTLCTVNSEIFYSTVWHGS